MHKLSFKDLQPCLDGKPIDAVLAFAVKQVTFSGSTHELQLTLLVEKESEPVNQTDPNSSDLPR